MIKGIGIDLGTTNSALACVGPNDEVFCVKNAEGKTCTPSAVTYYNGEYIVGESALNVVDKDQVASYFKPHMGLSSYIVSLGNQCLGAIELSGMVLKKLKEDAEAYLGQTVNQAVITVPAYFTALHRDATIEAAKLAGLQVQKLINEPTAAALHYGVNTGTSQGYFLVYDLGGGTFDVSLIKLEHQAINVVASRGDYSLGGANWRDAIAEYVADSIISEGGPDISNDLSLAREIAFKAEKAKIALSTMQQASISAYINGNQSKYVITRDNFENITLHLMGQTLNLIEDLLQETGVSASQLDQILLVGGSCRMPMVTETLRRTFGIEVRSCTNLDEVVACGAALESARSLNQLGKTPGFTFQLRSIQDVTGHSLGLIATDEERSKWVNSILIPKDSKIPAAQTEPFELMTPREENSMDIYLTQGEERDPKYCTVVARYEVSGIPKGPDSKQKLQITYGYNESGVIEVSAKTAAGERLAVTKQPEIGDLSWLDLPPSDMRTYTERSVILSVDLSGSMSGYPLEKCQKAAKEFIEKLSDTGAGIGLVIFADRDMLQCGISHDPGFLIRKVDEWSIGLVGGGTSGSPFKTAKAELSRHSGDRWLLVLTDGMWFYQDEAVQDAQSCHQEGIMVVGIGFGSADEEFLKAISNSSLGSCFTDLDSLSSNFSRIATEIGSGRARLT